MQTEQTLGDVYEEIADKLALARTKALMGEHAEALAIFQAASLDYIRFRDVLSSYPGFHALEHAFSVTMTALQNHNDSTPQTETQNANRNRNRRELSSDASRLRTDRGRAKKRPAGK